MKKMLSAGAFCGALLAGLPAYACVQMEGSFVVNYCGYRVMGNYKGDDGSWGGFGPIRPGGREATSKRANAGWNVSYCNYELSVNGSCKPKHPRDM